MAYYCNMTVITSVGSVLILLMTNEQKAINNLKILN